MEIILKKKPKNPIIIEGFPGLGLISTIVTEFLIKHLNAKSIGYIKAEEIPPVAAVHESRVVQPLELFYDKKSNLLIVHALSDVKGMEWEIAKTMIKLASMLKAKEIISIEGIMSSTETNNAYYLCNKDANSRRMAQAKILPLKEGIIMGVTAAMMLTDRSVPKSGIFVETHTRLPDSRSAAKAVEVLDNYLGLKVDYKPLIKMAEEFEAKLKTLLTQTKKSQDYQKQKELSYMG